MSNLSEAQKEILTIEQFYPNSGVTTISVHGDLGRQEPEKVIEYMEKFIDTHESFRMQLRKEGGEVERYYVEKTASVTVKNVREEEVKKLIDEKTSLNYFKWNDYLYDMTIFVSDSGHVHVCLCANHIMVDGIGAHIFVDGMYDLIMTGECQKPQLTLDECVEEEKAYYASSKPERHKKFWKEKVAEYEGVALTHVREFKADQLRTSNYVVKVEGELTKKLVVFCNEHNLSMTQLLSALLLIYKSKKTNKTSVGLSTIIHARGNRRKRGILSTFARALPLIVDVNGELTVLEYLESLKSELSQLMRHYKISHSDLIACTRGISGLDDLAISVQMNNSYMEKYSSVFAGGGWVMPKESLRPLTVHVKEESYLHEETEVGEDVLYLDYEYLSSYIDEQTIVDMHKTMERILSQVVEPEPKLIKDITLVSEEEYKFLVEDYPGEYVSYPKKQTIVDLFEEQAVKVPNNRALIYKDTVLTYKELNEKTNQLAHYLIETYDIQPEDKVGLLLDRSEWMIISILGIMKAGAAYVPMSPEFPQDRIDYMAETSEFKTVLVEADYSSSLPAAKIVKELDLAGYPTTNPMTDLASDNLAYVFFTSGTTGKPKGVMIEHHQVNNAIVSMRETYGFGTENERLLFFSNYVFDVSIEQIFLALLYGDPLIVMPDQLWMDQEKFISYLNEHEVTYVHMTPSFLTQIDLSPVKSLKRVVIVGESVTPYLVEKVAKHNAQLVNGYGPTEATVVVTVYLFGETEERNLIGSPLANTTIYILDEHKRLVPKGSIGEMYIGGVQVSRGYIKQPELTAERFIANPYQTEEQKLVGWNDRIYQTGDLVRMLEDGTLEYHGRNDFQVKVRGFRIELGEIETALLQVTGISQVYVTALGEEGSQYLGAYYVSEEEIDQEILESELGSRLPAYMIPSAYQQMLEFPLTVNGKLDRRALPAIGFDSNVEYVAPSTEMESIVAQSYTETLEVAQVGINDDFFKLGGHSLRALRLVNLLEEYTGKAIEVRHVFEAPKVAQLASLLEGLEASTYERIPKVKEKDFYTMSSAQKRMYLLWKFSPNEVTYNMPAMLRFDERLDESRLTEAINQLTERHEILRTTFTEKAGDLVQVVRAVLKTRILVREMSESEVKSWYEGSIKAFDLEAGPMYRVEIARTSERDYLFVDMHHIISDGMSSTIFVRELNALMAGLELPPLSRQYKDYSAWMTALDLSQSEDYWRDRLAEYPVLALQTDYPRPAEQVFHGAMEQLILDKETTRKIKQLIRQHNVTAYMFFMALISTLLGKLANQGDLIIGSPVSGRIHRDTESMLGMFVNTLAMRMKPVGEKTFVSYLEEVKAQTLEAQSHQVYPFEDLVEKLSDSRDASRHPLFDVLVAYQNNEELGSVMGSSTMIEAELPARFDLTFMLSDHGEETFIDLTYATSLFSEITIKTYLERLEQLLDQILEDAAVKIQDLNALLPVEEQKRKHRLSEAQKEILMIEYFYPNSGATTVSVHLNIGVREVEKAKERVGKFLVTHESFRMKLRKEGEEVQRYYVKEVAPINVAYGTREEVDRWIDEKTGANYFKWDDYLYDMSLYVCDDGKIHACLSANHIIMDGIGAHLFVIGMYDVLISGECEVPSLSLNECVAEEQAYYEKGRGERHKAFWQEKMEEYDGIALTDGRDLKSDQLKSENYVVKVEPNLTKKIVSFCKENNLSMTQLLSALLLVYKSKMTNKRSVAISLPIHARSNHQKKTVLSTFVRILPLIVEVDGELSILEYMEYMKSELSQLMRNYKVSHGDMIECTKGTSGLDDLSISVQMNDQLMEKYGSVLIEGGWVMPKESLRPLTVHVKEETFLYEEDECGEEKLYLDYEYLPSLLEEDSVIEMHERMERLFAQVVASDGKLIKDMTLLGEEESKYLIEEYQGEYVPYPKDKTVIELFEEQVEKSPSKQALVYKGTVLTYEELNEKANQLSHYLIEAHGIKPEDKVGLLLDRSEWMVISILGVLKAGAAYVPMSPSHPEERVNYMMEISEVKLTLVESMYASRLDDVAVIEELELDSYSKSNPVTELKPENLAYVIFTSGTTGQPKGVMIEHRQINNLIQALRKGCGLEAGKEVVLFFSNYVFDASAEQIYSPLLNGDVLIVMPDNLWMDQEKFIGYLNAHEVTYLDMTASLLLQIDLGRVPSLRAVLTGGESVTPPLLEKIRQWDLRFMNGYGPAEATIMTTLYEDDGKSMRNIIGYPIENMTNYVLDENRRLVSKGTIGELYVGGAQISRGYINQPELTSEKFIPNPYQTAAQRKDEWNDRLYQTGDLVRMLEDGRLEYHGRNDLQVKVRGFRIELGEIENSILQIEGITQAHVMALGEEGSRYIVAYYVSEEEISEEVLDQELGSRVPDYMIPSGYQHMTEFPLTVNGKLDQRALPEFGFDSSVEYVAPTTELEEMVCSSYEEVLGVDQVGLNDDFFKLG
ncbi:MAG: amino acid adenylation domain-containing protein, partial [Turicibacter sp.]|nr:amino acid adenylation domain-containing protein [Turicibacter sp.]